MMKQLGFDFMYYIITFEAVIKVRSGLIQNQLAIRSRSVKNSEERAKELSKVW